MNTKQLKGMAVISIAEGHRLGTVHRVYADTNGRKIVGLEIDCSGHSPLARQVTDLFQGNPTHLEGVGFLASADIHAIGPDAVTVDEDAKLHPDRDPLAEGEDVLDLDTIVGRKVVTENGTQIGEVAAIDLDRQGLATSRLEASAGFFSSNTHIPIDQVTSFGGDIVVVSDAVLPSDHEPAALAAGGNVVETVNERGDTEYVIDPGEKRRARQSDRETVTDAG